MCELSFLLFNLSCRSLGGQHPSLVTGLGVKIVLNSQLGKMANDVLHLGVVVAALCATKVVEPRNLVEKVVDDGNDDGDEDGVHPNNDKGNGVDPSILAAERVVVGV
jgi:hypothetical protein